MFIRDKKRTEEDKTRNVGTPERKLFTASSSLLPERKLHVLSLSLIKHKGQNLSACHRHSDYLEDLYGFS